MKNMYIKIASIIEILLGLVIGGFGGFIFLLSMSVVGPTAIIGLILGIPMFLLSIFLVIFGINLLKLKKWAWLASVITLIIAIAFLIMFKFSFKAFSQPIFSSLCLGAIICLILLILERMKERGISVPWKKILIIVALIIAGVAGYYLYRNLQRPVSPPVTPPETGKPVIEDEAADWKVYKDGGYGYEFKYPDGFYIEIESTKISDLPEKTEMGLSLAEVLNEQDLIYNSGVDDDCSMIGASISQGAKSYCEIKQFGQVKGKLEKYYVGEDPSFGIKFVFYKNEARISLSAYQGLPELYQLDYENRILKFNEYFDSIVARDSSNADLAYYDTFEKALSTLKFIEEGKIADWETYRNENYGFSFAYPRNFQLIEFQLIENDFIRGSLLADVYIEDPTSFSLVLLQDIYKDFAQTPEINLDVVKTSKTITQLLDHTKEVINEQTQILKNPEAPYYGAPPPEIKSIEIITIGDLKMTKVVQDMGPGGPNPIFLTYYIVRPGYVFVFSANYDTRCGTWAGGDCGATEKEILPRILSSLNL